MSPPSNASRAGPNTRELRRGAGRSVAMLAALSTIYYALPVGELPSHAATVATTVVGLLTGVAVLTLLATVQIRHHIRSGAHAGVRIQSLLAIVYLAVVLFATGYYALATVTTAQMSGLETKTDALYFTMTTLGTVGFGDVHATGQAARAVVTIQIVFNLVVIGALASTFGTLLRQRVAGSSTAS